MSDSLRDRVWLTARIRMRTEARMRKLSLFLNILPVWFSTILTCWTVYQLTAPKSDERDVISAALAIVVLALSIFIPSLGLEKQAEKFRECYLKLQRLMDTVENDADFTSAYYDILEAYPNHPTRDRTDFIVASVLKGQKLYDSKGSILPTKFMYIDYCFRWIFSRLAVVAAVLSPSLLYFFL